MTTQSTTQNTLGADLATWLEWAWPKAAAAVVTLWMQFPVVFLLLLLMAVIDIATGYSAAKARGEARSEAIRAGVWGKLTVWLASAGGFAFDRFLAIGQVSVAGFSMSPSIGSALCGIFIFEEFISILKNVGKSGRGKSVRFRKLLAGLQTLQGERDEK